MKSYAKVGWALKKDRRDLFAEFPAGRVGADLLAFGRRLQQIVPAEQLMLDAQWPNCILLRLNGCEHFVSQFCGLTN